MVASGECGNTVRARRAGVCIPHDEDDGQLHRVCRCAAQRRVGNFELGRFGFSARPWVLDELWHIWRSHVTMRHATHEWVASHVNESCLVLMRHITREWVMFQQLSQTLWTSAIRGFCSPVSAWWVLSIGMRRVSHEWGMSHKNESCHIWRRNVTCEWYV